MASKDKALEVEKQEVPIQEGTEHVRNQRVYIPNTDIFETDDKVVVIADIPGVDEKSVDITLEKNILTINAYVDAPQLDGYALAYAEYEIGDYQRRFTLSSEIDRDNIEAVVKDGILRLFLPKAKSALARKIAVTAG